MSCCKYCLVDIEDGEEEYCTTHGERQAICGNCHTTKDFVRFEDPDEEVWVCDACNSKGDDGMDLAEATLYSQIELEKMQKEGRLSEVKT